ncbi:MAG: glycosyltransferase family 39 protein, partial [Anaerolineales bacterium]|nr:glycosyltransferase family 39 protein [Anaerolineales bacterium]
MTENLPPAFDKKKIINFLIPTLIVLVAFTLRIVDLDGAPPGITHDEAAHLNDAQRIVDGYRPIYLTTAYGREPFFDYITATFVYAFGMTIKTGRLVSALWGTALVVLVYAWCRNAFDRNIAILSAILLAISFWPVSTSRQILRSVTMPVLLTAAIFFFWKAV